MGTPEQNFYLLPENKDFPRKYGYEYFKNPSKVILAGSKIITQLRVKYVLTYEGHTSFILSKFDMLMNKIV